MVFGLVWAMGAAGQQQVAAGQGDMLTTVVQFAPMILIFFVFYLLIIRPQQKKQRAVQDMVANLKKGDKVITSSGMYAVVTAIKKNTVVLKISDNTKVEFLKSAVSGLQKSEK